MTVRMAENVIKPVNLPVKCSACFNQQPELRHIDFDAANDRGFYGDGTANDVTMDDLILCENCIGEASRQLGWVPASEWKERQASLEMRLKDAEERETKMANYSERMEDALKHRPGGDILTYRDRPRRGRPKIYQEDLPQ